MDFHIIIDRVFCNTCGDHVAFMINDGELYLDPCEKCLKRSVKEAIERAKKDFTRVTDET